jgi:hypothetical protein
MRCVAALAVALLACKAPTSALVEPPQRAASAPSEASAVQPAFDATGASTAQRCPRLTVAVPEVPLGPEDPALVDIVDAERLAPFFERAARLLRGRADDHVRIAVYGDSNLTMDYLTGQMRRTLQAAHGDAGHGFVSFGRPWSHYKHMDVRHEMKRGWQPYACSTHPTPDRLYGISGIAAESSSVGAVTWVATAGDDAPIGRTASRFEVFFLRGERWGKFDILADGEVVRSVDSRAPAIGLGVERFELDDAPHRIEVVARDRQNRVRMLGIALERGTPSFVVDSFGVGSMNTASQWREDPALNHEMLVQRGYDLIIFATGANDGFGLDTTPTHLAEIIARHRKALPNAPILILTPADRGKEKTFYNTRLAIEQRRVIAKDNQAALWDLWLGMGGERSMGTFYRRGMSINDYVHFNEKGGRYMGQRLTHALWTALARHVAAHPEAGCREPDLAQAATSGGGRAAP